MKLFIGTGRLVAAIMLFALFSTQAYAQATRTWVSGVGDDVNPCSRTAPCKTFAGAISKTAAHGTINTVDSGGFGAVTITKSITIDGEATEAGILAAGSNGIIINAGANDNVIIRNVAIEGANTGLNGIRILSAGNVLVDNVQITRFTGKGIDVSSSVATNITVQDTNIMLAAGGGISLTPNAMGTGVTTATLNRVTLTRNSTGLTGALRTRAFIRDSMANDNTANAFTLNGGAGVNTVAMTFDNTTIVGNGGVGIASLNANALATLSRTTIVGNATAGLQVFLGGQIQTFGDTHNTGNGANGAPNLPVVGSQ